MTFEQHHDGKKFSISLQHYSNMIIKIIISLMISIIYWLWHTHACTRIILSDEEIRMNHELIVTATVTSITHLENIEENFEFPEPNMFYNFHVEKIFKGDQNIETFTIAQESFSSCSSWYRSWTAYLLYLNQNTNNKDWYYPYNPATEIISSKYPVTPYFNTLWNTKRYNIYYNIKKEFFNIRRDIRIFLENKRYYLQYRFNYYKYKYGFY